MAEDTEKDKPEHPHGGPPGQTGEHPEHPHGGPPGQDKPDKPDEDDAPHVENPIVDPDAPYAEQHDKEP